MYVGRSELAATGGILGLAWSAQLFWVGVAIVLIGVCVPPFARGIKAYRREKALDASNEG